MSSAENSIQAAGKGDLIHKITSRKYEKGSLSSLEDLDEDVEVGNVDYRPGLEEFRKKQKFGKLTSLWLAYQSIGVIYGDIGTSPLYTLSSTFTSPPSNADLLGALSVIIWTLTLVVSVKYVFIVLSADDEGEGGSFALYSLLTRYLNIMQKNPRDPPGMQFERHMTKDLRTSNRIIRQWIERSSVWKFVIKAFAAAGVSLVIADGVLTPAQTVLGAIQGIKVVQPGISTEAIIGISCAILVVLFVIQPFGTGKLGVSFAPIVMIWLLFNGVFGIYNLVEHDESVLKAFSPVQAITFFTRNKQEAWKSLGGILLSFTGVEALFADLGAFSATAVRLSWLAFAYPCLLLAYIGQSAYISHDPAAVSNPFFNTVPPGMYWPSFVLSILAAVVASQAMITGAFQLISQTINMSYFPNLKIVHTSTRFHGQIYVPSANWIMMLLTVGVTAVFNNTTRLGYAYGVCVVTVTFITTFLVSIVALVVWKLHPLIVFTGFLFFGLIDGLYLSSALTKVPHGAWFTLMLGAILTTIILLWRYGKNNQWAAETHDLVPPHRIVHAGGPDNNHLLLRQQGGNDRILRSLKGLGVFFDKTGYLTPAVYTQFTRKFEAQHEITVFFNLRHIPGPHVPLPQRYSVFRVGVPGTFRVVARTGYADHLIDDEDLGSLLLEQVKHFLNHEVHVLYRRDLETGDKEKREKRRLRAEKEMVLLEEAWEKQIVYIFGKEQLEMTRGTGWVRRWAMGLFIWLRENMRSKPAEFRVPVDRLVEVGFIKEL